MQRLLSSRAKGARSRETQQNRQEVREEETKLRLLKPEQNISVSTGRGRTYKVSQNSRVDMGPVVMLLYFLVSTVILHWCLFPRT